MVVVGGSQGVALETGVSVAAQPHAILHPTSFSNPNTGPARDCLWTAGRQLAVVFAPNHAPWMLAAWLCRRKHASALWDPC